MIHWWVAVALETAIQVLVCVGVEEEIGAGESIDVRAMVVFCCVGVEEFPGAIDFEMKLIVCEVGDLLISVITSFLEPNREKILIQAL
jgi:hypothetical protein